MALPKSLTLVLLLLASVVGIAIVCWVKKKIRKSKAKKKSPASPIEKGLMHSYRTKALPPTPPSMMETDVNSQGTEPQRAYSPLRRHNSADSFATDYRELFAKYQMPGSPGAGPKPPPRSISPSASVPRRGSAYSVQDRSGAASPPIRHYRRSSAPCNFVSLQELTISPQSSSSHLRASTPTSYQRPPLSHPPSGPDFSIGDRVQVSDDIDYLRSISNSAGGLKWHPAKQACIGQFGTIEAVDEKDNTIRLMMDSGRGFWFPEKALATDSLASRKNSEEKMHRKSSMSSGRRRNSSQSKPPIPIRIQTPGSLPQGISSRDSTPINSPRSGMARTPSLPMIAVVCT